jgi:hypothetical protein
LNKQTNTPPTQLQASYLLGLLERINNKHHESDVDVIAVRTIAIVSLISAASIVAAALKANTLQYFLNTLLEAGDTHMNLSIVTKICRHYGLSDNKLDTLTALNVLITLLLGEAAGQLLLEPATDLSWAVETVMPIATVAAGGALLGFGLTLAFVIGLPTYWTALKLAEMSGLISSEQYHRWSPGRNHRNEEALNNNLPVQQQAPPPYNATTQEPPTNTEQDIEMAPTQQRTTTSAISCAPNRHSCYYTSDTDVSSEEEYSDNQAKEEKEIKCQVTSGAHPA